MAKVRTLVVLLVALLASHPLVTVGSQTSSAVHDERIAGNRAEEFAWALSRNPLFAYELLDSSARARMPPPDFMTTVPRMVSPGGEMTLEATHVAAAGDRALDVFLVRRSRGAQHYFRFRMSGSAAGGYRVSEFSRLDGPPDASARRLRPDAGPFRTRRPASPNPQIAFVPVAADVSQVSALVDTFRDRLRLDTRLEAVYLPSPRARNAERAQLIGEVLAKELEPRCRTRAMTGTPFVIGVTGEDMYLQSNPRWRFAFSYRLRPCVAIVSYARMSIRGERPLDTVAARLRKMIAKNIGVLVYGLPPSKDPRNLMFDEILGIEDLDFIEDNFERGGMAPANAR